MKFRLLVGSHAGPKIDGEVTLYRSGDVIETDKDLERLFGSDKFRRIREEDVKASTPMKKDELEFKGQTTDEQLSMMTIAQLRQYAVDNGVNLTGRTTKADIVDAILAAAEGGGGGEDL